MTHFFHNLFHAHWFIPVFVNVVIFGGGSWLVSWYQNASKERKRKASMIRRASMARSEVLQAVEEWEQQVEENKKVLTRSLGNSDWPVRPHRRGRSHAH